MGGWWPLGELPIVGSRKPYSWKQSANGLSAVIAQSARRRLDRELENARDTAQ
jgi:hypothetical protein